MTKAERLLKIAKWRNDVELFLRECFPNHFNKPFATFHKEIYSNLQQYPFIAIAAPRKHGKSENVTFGWTMWNLLCNPNRRFTIIISNNFTNATQYLKPIKEEIETNLLVREVFGDLKCPDKWSENEAEFKHGKKIVVGGNDFKIRGAKFLQYRPDLVIIDDAEDDELVKSDLRRDNFENWLVKAVEPAMSIDTQHNQIIFVGTILHRASQLSKLQIGEGRYTKWKSLFYEAEDSHRVGLDNAKALWEEAIPLDWLLKEKQRDPLKYAQEFLNNPIAYEHAMFKEEYFDDYSDDKLPKDLLINITVDLACTDKEYSDYNVILPVGVDPLGDLWILPYHRAKYSDPDKLIDKMLDMYEKYAKSGRPGWKMGKFGIERNGFQRFLIHNFNKARKTRKLQFPVFEIQAKGDKTQRIGQLQPYFASNSIHIRADMLDLKNELLDFPRAMHDDIADALAHQLTFVSQKPSLRSVLSEKWTVTPEKQRQKILQIKTMLKKPSVYVGFRGV